jgi:hypothetical protein
MTNKPKDGGTAYPIPNSDLAGSYEATTGMTLRQWYAGMVLQGLLSSMAAHGVTDYSELAHDAFMAADKMIAHEEEKNG